MFDAMYYPYPSRRMVTYGVNGMVATSQTLAAQAGITIMQQGGNAVDAALAAAACLTVVEPTSNGLGGDCFALVWHKGEMYGLNASGYAPQSLSLDTLVKAGYKVMPRYGWAPVTVPGQPAGWAALSARFGKLPLSEVLKPAINYAANGFAISPVIGKHWNEAIELYRNNTQGSEFEYLFKTFTYNGRAPQAGDVFCLPDHARTLEAIGRTAARDFYQGDIAGQIDRFSNQYGGFLRYSDLACYQPEWVEPIKVNYRGYDVWEIPPNGHGLVALMALNILNGLEIDGRDNIESCHRQIEAMKLAFADGLSYIGDNRYMKAAVGELLSPAYAAGRRQLIGAQAIEPAAGRPQSGGTVYLAAADYEGTMVSFIQSNYMGFGSGLVVPNTGISLHNRGLNFSMESGHPNCLEPGKRPYHTIIPGLLTKDGQAVGPFGVMGAFMQPQGHVQVIVNTVDRALNPQAALDAPRWQWTGGKAIEVEPHFPVHIAEALARKGHAIKINIEPGSFGRGQIIWRQGNALAGGTDPRADSAVAVW